MKEQILHLDAHDDFISARDKMGWAQTGRVLLVWPDLVYTELICMIALTAFLVTFLYVGAGLALGAALAVLLQAGRTCARTRAHAGFRIAGFLFSAWAQA